MTFQSNGTRTMLVPPSHSEWLPHPYQERGIEFLTGQGAAMLWYDPGMGKTAITLAAFCQLMSQASLGTSLRMLVIAPLRPCQTVWPDEGKKWSQFRDLRTVFLHGPKKKELLDDLVHGTGAGAADIYLINPEGIVWLAKQFTHGEPWPFDIIVFDEITKFKNASSERSKALRGVTERGRPPRPNLLRGSKRRWGLTGTPAANGYLDLFGQFLVIDDGAALGRYATHYKSMYFQPDYNGFDFALQPGAELRIEERIKPYVLRMRAEDYLELPELVDDLRWLEMDTAAAKLYKVMKDELIAELPGGQITAANTAAVYSKLKQMANGAVYNDLHEAVPLHDIKMEALEDLLAELAGQPLLLAYEFQHDLWRLQARFGADLPVLRSGLSDAATNKLVADWNAGRLPLLCAHPQSAAHGLNMQGSGASHVAWLTPPWDLELYLQFIRRVRRQGNTSTRVVNHLFMMRGTIDELSFRAIGDKDTTQTRLMDALGQLTGAKIMETKLGTAPGAKIIPAGWGKATTTPPAEAEQKAAIESKITPPVVSKLAGAFSAAIQARMANVGNFPTGGATSNSAPAPVEEQAQEPPAPEEAQPGSAQAETAAAIPAPPKRTRRTAAEMAASRAAAGEVSTNEPANIEDTGLRERALAVLIEVAEDKSIDPRSRQQAADSVLSWIDVPATGPLGVE